MRQSETLGRYRILKELGRGAMGRVFLAHDPEIDRPVAIKTVQIFAALPAEQRAAARERFLREARAAGRLSHPGIVTVFDVGEQDGVPWLAMEYLEGSPLDRFARPDGLLPVALVAEIVAQAAEALDYAHRAGVVHRDIKPANLMRVGETAVKIMDFGLARSAEPQGGSERALFGSPSFMSPEQIRGEELDGRSDLFSLGAVLYQLLTGEKAFPGESVSSIIYRVVHEDPREAGGLSARVPPELATFLRRALAKKREERFADGVTFAEALRKAAGRLPAPAERGAEGRDLDVPAPVADSETPELPPPPPRRRRRRRSRAPWIAVLSALLLGSGATAWVYRAPLMEWIEQLRPAPREVWLETRIRTEPPGLSVTLDGEPLSEELVRFRPEGPFGTLQTSQGCRTVTHRIQAADAGGEVVLVPDPIELQVTLDPGVAGARVRLNGADAGTTPALLALDLCRENVLEVNAAGFREARLELEPGTAPLDARTTLAGLALTPIPRGTVRLPRPPLPVALYLDGKQVDSGSDVELFEGEHTLRLVNSDLWIDVTQTVRVEGSQTVVPDLRLPGIANLVVQAFPANAKVFLRRRGGAWRYVDEVPMRRRIAAGRYEVKVQLNPTGEERSQEIELRPGENPPVRMSFARRS